MASDPFEHLEKIEDSKVVEWGLNESRRCVESLKPLSDFIYEKALALYSIPVIYGVKRNPAGVFYMKRDRSYKVVLEGASGTVDLVDSNQLGRDAVVHSYYVDSGGRYFAYFYSNKGADVGELVVVDLRDLSTVDRIQGSISDVVFLERGGFYYTKFFRSGACPDGVEAPCERVYLRESGKDELVFGSGLRKNYFISLSHSADGRRALLSVSYGWTRNSLYAGPIEDPSKWIKVLGGDFRSFFIDSLGGEYLVAAYDLRGFGRVLRVRDEGIVSEVISERDVALQDAVLVGEHIVVSYLKDASSRIEIYSLNGELVDELFFEEPSSVFSMYSYGLGGFVEVRSFTKPYQVLEMVGSGGRVEFRKFVEYPKVVEARVTEDFAESRDGTKVHYFWVRSPRRRQAVVIYGYGGFGVPLTPSFAPWLSLLVDLGVDVAVANLRGGSEYGEEWHRAGMRSSKINVFYDYIAIAEKFKSMGYLVAGFGRSNGGLLIGSVITMRPDLLEAAAIGYPVLDMLKFHKLYVGAAWIPEYGDPDDPSDREYLLKYSPYHNVREGVEYPPIIVFTGLHDDRVHPAHALKFYAKLVSYGNKPCLRLETSSGHAGSSPEVLAREVADVVAFILKHLGLESALSPADTR